MKSSNTTHRASDASHEPVMLGEVLAYLDPKPGACIVDGTVDGGGHAAAILERMDGRGTFLGMDWDRGMIESTSRSLGRYAKAKLALVWVADNYARLGSVIEAQALPKPDGILLDLGFSTLQIESSGRGFGFSKDEPLLMTYSDELVPVRDLLRGMDAKELERVIRTYGEERFAGRIARAIRERGRKKPIEMSGELAQIVQDAVPANYERGRIHPATRTFQALRIYANHEIENLETFLHALSGMLTRAGRVVIISFHSLEDRTVKHCFREFEKAGTFEVLTKKPIRASREEVARNPKSRSAKLRAVRAVSSEEREYAQAMSAA